MIETSEQMIDIETLAEWLGVRKEWCYDQVQAKKLPHYRLGRQIRFKKSEIMAYLEASSVEPD